ncbi:MAG: alkaline phosphatase D family protein [Candidatus Andeanibacterium colombiense]|uniref:Alkaline phosphatase D family protein n=1 Tax=Candidatus Andeanibacterium colombiense TaxID=3121345 RepID=A0AAJ5X807_9SPHN|nr:MAG: alkaline phosphatase D family protein [Sphingomonadaceae bacterium]
MSGQKDGGMPTAPQAPGAPHLPVSRRTTLAGLAGSAALAVLPWRAPAYGAEAGPVFRHGVASGDPDAHGVVLWTRVTATGEQVDVAWELSRDPQFRSILRCGTVATGPERDYTVKLLADGLEPGETLYYRFRLGEAVSPTGRARTLPVGRTEKLGIALASCSNYPFGFFNSYDAIARDPGVDFVLHIGDYIYEYGADGWGTEIGSQIGRLHEPANEIVSLSDYRTRHAQYKTDGGSQAMHAAHTLLACWDDHESANNPWTGGAQHHQPETEGDWTVRRANSIRAYFEYMPVREPEWLSVKGRSRMQFWRSYSFGDLATLCTLETRHTARARQVDYADFVTSDRKEVTRLVDDAVGAPGRALISPELESDLSASLKASVAAGQPWRLIGNQIVIARIRVPDVSELGLPAGPDEHGSSLAWQGKWNLPSMPDAWDGYAWARERFYALSRDAGAGDLIFLSGDSHAFWANQLADGSGRPAGVELGTAGISSPGNLLGYGAEAASRISGALAEHNPEVLWTDGTHQGYVRLELTRERGTASFIVIDTALKPDYRPSILQRFAVEKRNGIVTLA